MGIKKVMNKSSLKKKLICWTKQSSKQIQQISTKFSKMAPGKKKIIISAAISISVLIFSVSLGLGLGLKSSSGESNNNPTFEQAPSTYYETVTGISINNNDLAKGKVIIKNQEYSIEKQNDEYFIKVPAFSEHLSPNKVISPSIFNIPAKTFSDNTIKGEGKDNFYNLDYLVPSLSIGIVRITNDGKIYGGYVDAQSANLDYQVNPILEKVYPHGYIIGNLYQFDSIVINGRGGINMLKLQKMLTLLEADVPFNTEEEVATALENVPTTTRFSFFLNKEGEPQEDYLRIAFNSRPTKPNEIGATLEDYPDPSLINKGGGGNEQYWWQQQNTISLSDHANYNYEFYVLFFLNQYGAAGHSFTLEKGVDYKNAAVDFALDKLNIAIEMIPGRFIHPVLGMIQPNVDGSITFNETITTENGEAPTITVNSDSTFSMPTTLVKISKNTFNNDNYATVTEEKHSGELSIEVEDSWLTSFQAVANDQRVKDLAKQMGITIRFITTPVNSAARFIKNNGIYQQLSAEVFFMHTYEVDHFKRTNELASLLEDGILKRNLENAQYYSDEWRAEAKMKTAMNKDQYVVYPFTRRNQFIAYNSDYLPNGLDFTNGQSIADYLYLGDLGDYGEMLQTKDPSTASEAQKQGLWVDVHLDLGGSVWALNYYSNLKKDQQQPNQQDVAWKKVTRGNGDTTDPSPNDYWSVFADPSLVNNPLFRKWVDHYYQSNSGRISPFTTGVSEYDMRALFNGHIGAIMVTPTWIDENWRKGEWRGTGTSEEKQAFAENTIKFQSVPWGLSSGMYAGISATLKNHKQKQQIAEKFISILTEPENPIDFIEKISKIPARKDMDLSKSTNKITSAFLAAYADTSSISRLNLPDWVYAAFSKTGFEINRYQGEEANIYQFAVDYFKKYLNENWSDINLFIPEDPDADAS